MILYWLKNSGEFVAEKVVKIPLCSDTISCIPEQASNKKDHLRKQSFQDIFHCKLANAQIRLTRQFKKCICDLNIVVKGRKNNFF